MNQLWLIPNHEVFSNIFCFDHDTIQPDILLLWLIVLRTQSFTSLKEDLLYISGVLSEHFLEGSVPLPTPDIAVPSRKYSFKATNKQSKLCLCFDEDMSPKK